jgi:hypothetical protein
MYRPDTSERYRWMSSGRKSDIALGGREPSYPFDLGREGLKVQMVQEVNP